MILEKERLQEIILWVSRDLCHGIQEQGSLGKAGMALLTYLAFGVKILNCFNT